MFIMSRATGLFVYLYYIFLFCAVFSLNEVLTY